MSLPEGIMLDISIDCMDWQSTLGEYEQIISDAVREIIRHVPEGKLLNKFAHLEISIVLCDDALIQELNRDYRKQDKPTNVLTFMGLDVQQIEDYLHVGGEVPQIPTSLGELYITFQVTSREAHEAGISLKDHFCHLVIHGMLHLLGYDHIKDDEAEIMEAIESRLLGYLGIDDPYSA